MGEGRSHHSTSSGRHELLEGPAAVAARASPRLGEGGGACIPEPPPDGMRGAV